MKKLLALVLSLLMVFAVVPMAMISANAETNVGDVVKFYFGTKSAITDVSGKPNVTADQTLTIGNYTTNKPAQGAGMSATIDGVKYSSYPWCQVNNVTAGQYVTFTSSSSVDAGVYSVGLATRAINKGRSLLDVEVNGTKLATDLNTNISAYSSATYYISELSSLTVSSATTLTIKVTGKDSGNMFLGELILTKTAEAGSTEPTEPDEPVASPISTDDKAAIRLDVQGGIRFYSTIDEDAIAALNTENETVEMGTLIGPENLVGDTLDIDDVTAENAVKVAFTSENYFEEGDASYVVGTIAKVKEKNYARNFVGRGYVKIGETYYYSDTVCTRSLKTIAAAYAADGYPNATDAQKELVDTWAAAADYVG